MFEYHLPCVMFVNDETTAMGEERMFKSWANRCIYGVIQPAYRPWMIPPKPEALYDHAWGAYATIDADDIEMEQWSKRERMRADAYDALANRNRHRVFS